MPFRDGIDDEADARICDYTNRKMVRGAVKWMIAKVRRIDLYLWGDVSNVISTFQGRKIFRGPFPHIEN
jgi:hypothetical protein